MISGSVCAYICKDFSKNCSAICNLSQLPNLMSTIIILVPTPKVTGVRGKAAISWTTIEANSKTSWETHGLWTITTWCFVLFQQYNCTKVKSFLSHRLGQYIVNVTRAAEVCSDFLCKGNGRCIRRDPHARHYLHLSADSYQIRPSGNEDFTVTGWPSLHELQLLTEKFRCHCYEGHEGERCDSINKVKEDDGEREEEEKEKERKRTEWENEQGKQCEGRESTAPSNGCSLGLMMVVLLLNLLVKTVTWCSLRKCASCVQMLLFNTEW